jgi:hypothetical protein
MSPDFWLLPTKFQLTSLTRLNRSIVHSYSLCCKCSPISSERSQSVARRRCVETFGIRQCCAQAGLPSYLRHRLLPILVGRRPIHRSDLFTLSPVFIGCNQLSEFSSSCRRSSNGRSLHSTVLGYLLPIALASQAQTQKYNSQRSFSPN